jgi:hypothetical protein
MDHILASASGPPPTEDRRRERSRASRREPLFEYIAIAHPEDGLNARLELAAIRRKVGDRSWNLLSAVATGCNYKDISTATSMRAGAIRVKVLRLRAELAAAA